MVAFQVHEGPWTTQNSLLEGEAFKGYCVSDLSSRQARGSTVYSEFSLLLWLPFLAYQLLPRAGRV